MGVGSSAENHEILDEIGRSLAEAESETTVASQGTRLFKLEIASGRHEWRLKAPYAIPKFYDENEDRLYLPPHWHLEVEPDMVDVSVSHALDMRGDQDERRATFLGSSCWSLKFPNKESYNEFWREYQNKLFENTWGVKNTSDNRKELLGAAFADRVFTSSPQDEMDFCEEQDDDMNCDLPKKEKESHTADGDSTVSLLRVGIGDNSYIVRGERVELLRNLDDGVQDSEIKFRVKTNDGKSVQPTSMMLAHGETRMGVLTADNPSSLMYTDIETGTLVNEWKFRKNNVEIPMKDIIPETKNAQAEERSTFLGFDKDRICRWDLRDPSGIVQQMQEPVLDFRSGKDYAKYTNFTCMATTGDGCVVVGSKNGTVRLYSNKLTLTRASTAFPALGEPITHVDVTYNGSWVIATTDHFIEVLKTTATTEEGEFLDGFKKSLGANAYQPKLLKLTPEDMIRVGKAPLMKARFAFVTESGHREKHVVASCGKWTVIWNFQQVRTGRSSVRAQAGLQTNTTYRLLRLDDNVLDAAFMHESHGRVLGGTPESALVVATPKKVWSRWD